MGELIAHRGYPAHYPENSIASIQAALATGAGYVEVDVQLSRDQFPVLFHDRDLKRLCHQSGAIHDYDWEQLQQFTLHADSELVLQQSQAPLASLGDLVAIMPTAPATQFFIELKRASIEQFGASVMLSIVLPVLEPVKSQCCLISFDLPILERVRKETGFPIGVVIDNWGEREAPAISALEPEYLFCNLNSFPKDGQLQYHGASLAAYETTNPSLARELMRRGVDLVETDAIGELRRELAENQD
ncbi:MAG: glycerophosphodiester phosphodiesterase family protein [Thiohalophilus sp.]|jgi:glycerophosphoryl diester phosphodiesterase